MPHSITVLTPQNVYLEYNVANLGDRLLAFLIDTLIKVGYGILGFLILMPFILNDNLFAAFLIGGILVIPLVFYTLAFEVLKDGQTPGKKAMNIKVVAIDGGEVTLSMYVMRWLFRLVDVNMMSGLIAILTIALTEKAQRVGDIVANTGVISLKSERTIEETSFEKLDLEYFPKYPMVSQLSYSDITTIKEALNNDSEDALELRIKLSKKLEEVLDIEKDSSSEDFLKSLVKDYNYYQLRNPY